MNWKIVGSTVSAALIFTTLCILSFLIGESKIAVALNFAVLVFGISVGWVIGIVVSPYSKAEQQKFTVISKAIAVFFSGYLVGKLDKLIEKLLAPSFVLDSIHGFRLLAFVSSLIVTIVITFIYREYAR